MQHIPRRARETARTIRRFDQEVSSCSAMAGKLMSLPFLLLQHMADQIVLVQALHDQDDATRLPYC